MPKFAGPVHRRRIADFLARTGLHIAPSTVRRMLNRAPATETPAPVAPAKNPDESLASAKPPTVIANYPNHVWGIDTTRPRAHVRHHGCRPGPRLERDWTSWPRRSGARGTWRRSRSDGATDWYPGDTVFP
ncbi:MAG: hypothetical protein WBP56_07475, partial [Polyangia bacterium]